MQQSCEGLFLLHLQMLYIYERESLVDVMADIIDKTVYSM